jgi:hypothetical protein
MSSLGYKLHNPLWIEQAFLDRPSERCSMRKTVISEIPIISIRMRVEMDQSQPLLFGNCAKYWMETRTGSL